MVYDLIIIGGGIVGISTAWQLKKAYPRKRILLLEKETGFSRHQTGHNSGVVHAGVYYAPGSLKAQFCREGNRETVAFCRRHGIACERCGKLLVATDTKEEARMQALFERCRQNEIKARLLGRREMKRMEPHIEGTGAIFVADSAIVDYGEVSVAMAEQFLALGGEVRLQHEVCALRETDKSMELEVGRAKERLQAGFVIVCAGLMADRLACMQGLDIDFSIIPYRGEYYKLAPRREDIVSHLIYPIPDPELPFLGIHLTRMIDGSITVGPNAVQGWKREGYGRLNFDLQDTLEMLAFPGFWKATANHLAAGLKEMKNSLWKRGYLEEARKYCPRLQLADLLPYPAGIRAQAVLRDGSLVHDFLFAESRRSLHVCNAPSPAATSALPIGRYISAKTREKIG